MVLHHVPQPAAVLGEIRRALAPGGLLVLTDFNAHNEESMRAEYGDHWLGFDRATLHAHLARAGFAIVESALAPVERGLALHIIVARHASPGGATPVS